MPKVSVLVPVHNVEKYIAQCLESVINQTLNDIEIICVLDGGKDSSAKICQTFAAHDNRIKVIDHVENRGLLAARKTGVDAAKGEYIMFLDSDDWLESDSCSRLYECIKSTGVDILQFGSFVDAEPDVPKQRVAGVEKLLAPYVGKLVGKKVFEGAFVEEKFRFSIWNKVYRSELCKKAYGGFSTDEYIFKAEDLCAFFRLAYFAESYIGITDKFYHYRFGAGITGKNRISLATFQTICQQSEVSQKCRLFLNEQGTLEVYSGVYDRLNMSLLNECINNWYSYLDKEDSVEGFKCILKYWDGADVAIAIAKRWYFQTIMLSDRIYAHDILPYKHRKIRKVAIYYHRYSMGGVQKVLSLLMSALLEQGYEVLLITDEKPTKIDYALPDSIERVIISASNKPEEYPSHAISLRNALEAFGAELMIYNATSSSNLLFDLLISKTMGIPVVLYIHEYYGVGLSHFFELPIRKIKTFRFADKVVALSQAQRDYWRATGSNAVYMPNPFDQAAHSVKPSLLNNHDIIWVGRLSGEKRYTDALDILSKVVKVIPDVRLLFVGSFSSDKDEREFRRKVKSYGIRNNVQLCGYMSDVFSIYEKCSLFLLTSEAESYCMSLAESKVAGLPCVMYQMPYLEMQRDSRGMIAVRMMDTSAAADAIITIFSDKELMCRLGAEARESIQPILSYDYGKGWKQLIDSLETYSMAEIDADKWCSHEIIVNNLIDTYLGMAKRYQNLKNESNKIASPMSIVPDGNNPQLQELLAAANKEILLIRMSASYKIGRFVTWGPRKLRGFIRCQKENGWSYTWRRLIEHIYIPIKTKIKLIEKWLSNTTDKSSKIRINSSESNFISAKTHSAFVPKDISKHEESIISPTDTYVIQKQNTTLLLNKRILIVTHQLEYTGSEHSLLRMCHVLLNQGASVDVWSFSNGGFSNELNKVGVNVKIVDSRSFTSPEMQELIRKYDLAISNTALTYSFVVAAQDIIRTIWYIREAQNLALMLPGNKGLLEALLNANNIYCVSEYARDFIVSNYNKHVRVLHNCVEDEYPQYKKKKKPDDGDKLKFLTLGTIEKRKGYDVFVRAYLGLSKLYRGKCEIHFAGRLMPYDWAKRFHEPFLQEIEGKEGIKYYGEITNRPELLKLIDEADVVVVASRDESCSLVALEGAMMGKPLIVTENVGAKYIVNSLNGWIVRTEDEDSLRKAFIDAIDNSYRLESMGAAARAEYLKTATYRIFEDKFVKTVIVNLY